MDKPHGFFKIIGVMAKTLFGYWSGHPCLVGVAGPNLAGMLIIKAEKCTRIDITCSVTILMMTYHTSYF